MNEAEQYEAIRRQVEQRFQQRQDLYTHVAVYTLTNIVLWVIYGLTTGMAWQIAAQFPIAGLYSILTFPWPLFIMAAWGIGLIAHGMNYYVHYGEGATRRREAINREIEREMALSAAYEKPKNDSELRLTDDGELDEGEDDTAWLTKRKHR